VTSPGYAQIDGFMRDGVALVRGLLDRRLLELARAGVDEVLANPSPLAIVASRPDEPVFFEDFCNWERIPEIGRVATHPHIAAVATAMMRSTTVRLYHDHVLVKEIGSSQRTPWHQDQPYYDVEGAQNISFWIALDGVPISASLECVRGSHRGPWLMPRTFLDREARWFPEGSLDEIPDYAPGDPRIARYALEAGDAIAFHFLTVHGAPGTTARRRVLSLRYLGDDARHARRAWRTSPPFDDVAAQLPPGAAMDHPRFPLLDT
jgi:ectoine hydroxylase-related dioxygenase (phytanoyl-CoA dioxygenase family)